MMKSIGLDKNAYPGDPHGPSPMDVDRIEGKNKGKGKDSKGKEKVRKAASSERASRVLQATRGTTRTARANLELAKGFRSVASERERRTKARAKARRERKMAL